MSRRAVAVRRRPVPVPEIAHIHDLAHDGRGVARIDGKTVFVADALPGEDVVLVRTLRHPNYDEARLEKVLNPSPDRIAPGCPHFGLCGGCALQHLDTAAQLRFKERQLLEAFERIGLVTPGRLLAPLGGPQWQYRRRARLGARWVPRKGRALVGFRERGASLLAELQGCPVLAPPLDTLLEPLSGLIGTLALRERIPQIEVAVGEGATALVFRVLEEPGEADRALLRAFGARHAVDIWLQPGSPQTLRPLDERVTPLVYTLPSHDVAIEFRPIDFIQVNGGLNRLMVSHAIALLQPATTDRVLDLYCGLGNFTLPLARVCVEVTGVDGEASLIEQARANARRNGLANATFHVANLFAPEGDAWADAWTRARYDRVLLDPPRAGARETLPLVARTGCERIVYVSCHPASLARDAGLLVREHGYALTDAGVMDMFPHTAHVESVAVFARQ